jgi:hypothetical protein
MNDEQIVESDDSDTGERGTGVEGILEQEEKVLGLLPYKEPVGFFFLPFFQHF